MTTNAKLHKKFYDVSKLTIWGDKISDDPKAKSPSLVFSFRDGNPRFTVYTGVTGPEGVIVFPSDYPTMVAAMTIFKDIIRSEPGTKAAIGSLSNVYVDNRPTNEKKVNSTLYVGKSKEGLIYFSVISENKPKIVFTIKASPYHTFRDTNGNDMAAALVSEKIATGLADLILNIISHVIVNYTNEDYANGKKQITIDSNFNKASSGTNSPVDAKIIQDLDNLGL